MAIYRQKPRSRIAGLRRRLALIALTTALVVSASAVPIVVVLPLVAVIPIGINARMLVEGETAVVADHRDQVNEVAAYDLRTGDRLWRTAIAGTTLAERMFVSSSTVVVATAHDIGFDQIEGFSLATGARRWIAPAVDAEPIPDGLLVYQQAADGTAIELIDPVTGATRWRSIVANTCDTYLANEASQTMSAGLMAVCPDTSQIVTLDLATGGTRARARIDLFTSGRPHPGTNDDVTQHAAPG